MLEKKHLELRVLINDKLVKLAMLDYNLKKQQILLKTIDEVQATEQRIPFVIEIDQLKVEEASVLKQIIDSQQELRIAFLYDDY